MWKLAVPLALLMIVYTVLVIIIKCKVTIYVTNVYSFILLAYTQNNI